MSGVPSHSASEATRGARRRTRVRAQPPIRAAAAAFVENGFFADDFAEELAEELAEDSAQDSGLSSESSTPTGGSPTRARALSRPLPRPHSRALPRPIPPRALGEPHAPGHAQSPARDYSRTASARSGKLARSRSTAAESAGSYESLRNRRIPSPLRPPKSAQSLNFDSGEEGSIRIDREGYHSMFQDIVSIKTMLLKLKRVLQESGENGLTRAETLNPFDDPTKNGLFYNLNDAGTIDASTSPGENNIVDELSDLRRQVIFLRGQLEEKDRTIQTLRFQMSKVRVSSAADARVGPGRLDACNAATQTEKISRPVSSGPGVLQSLPQDIGPMGPLVSWSKCHARSGRSGGESG